MNFLSSLFGSGGGESSSQSIPTHNESDLSGGNINFAKPAFDWKPVALIGGIGLAAILILRKK